jgi:hypothetical protein
VDRLISIFATAKEDLRSAAAVVVRVDIRFCHVHLGTPPVHPREAPTNSPAQCLLLYCAALFFVATFLLFCYPASTFHRPWNKVGFVFGIPIPFMHVSSALSSRVSSPGKLAFSPQADKVAKLLRVEGTGYLLSNH